MYQTIDLINIPSTLEQLGEPVEVGGSAAGLGTAAPTQNYAIKVKLNTAMDVPVGKIVYTSEMGYPGQPKIAKNNQGMYVISYVGIDSIYSHDMTTDPESDSWTDSSNIGAYVSKDKYYRIDLNDSATFKYIHKDLGYSYIFDEGNDFAIRYVFVLPDASSDPKARLGLGTMRDTAIPPYNVITGVEFEPTVSMGTVTYSPTIKGIGYPGGTPGDALPTLYPNKIYTMDLIHVSEGGEVYARFWDEDGYVATLFRNDLWVYPLNGNKLCTWSYPIGGTLDTSVKLYGAQVWMNTVIIKKSLDGCRSWERTSSNPISVGNSVKEGSVSLDNGGIIHLVWTEKTGAPSGYFNVFYSVFSNGEWSTPEQVSQASSNYDRLNPNIEVDKSGLKVYICWRKNISTPGNADIWYAYKDAIYMDEFELGVIE